MRVIALLGLILAGGCGGDDDGVAGAGDAGPGGDGTSPYPGPCVIETDEGADDVVDLREVLRYDAHGNKTLHEADTDVDGDADLTNTFSYDDDDLLLATESDIDGDGEIDNRTTYEYDDRGRLELIEGDDGVDGVIDRRVQQQWDSSDRLILDERDYDGDGSLDYRATYAYQSDRTTVDMDSDADEVIDIHVVEIHNGDDLVDRREEDAPPGGPLEWVTTYSYQGDLMTQRDLDEGDDGTIDQRNVFSYDDRGSNIEEERDDGADGAVDWRQTRSYDDRGNLLVLETDPDGDGDLAIDSRITRAYACFE